MDFIVSLFKIIICAGLIAFTLQLLILFTIYDVIVGLIVRIFGGKWEFSSPEAWSGAFDHWAKGEFLF